MFDNAAVLRLPEGFPVLLVSKFTNHIQQKIGGLKNIEMSH